MRSDNRSLRKFARQNNDSGQNDGVHGNGDSDKDFSMPLSHSRSIVKYKRPV